MALVIGSMWPDLAYLLNGSPVGIWADGFPGLATFFMRETLVVAWLVVIALAGMPM